jgi:bleomycin hydrolase
MRKLITLSLVCFALVLANAKDSKSKKDTSYVFTKVYDNAHTSVKDQCSSGTCWSFSGLSFLESENIRFGGKSLD